MLLKYFCFVVLSLFVTQNLQCDALKCYCWSNEIARHQLKALGCEPEGGKPTITCDEGYICAYGHRAHNGTIHHYRGCWPMSDTVKLGCHSPTHFTDVPDTDHEHIGIGKVCYCDQDYCNNGVRVGVGFGSMLVWSFTVVSVLSYLVGG